MKIVHSASTIEKAEELLQILSIWGVSRLDAAKIGHLIGSMAGDISEKKYIALAGGATIKPAPTDAEIAALVSDNAKA